MGPFNFPAASHRPVSNLTDFFNAQVNNYKLQTSGVTLSTHWVSYIAI